MQDLEFKKNSLYDINSLLNYKILRERHDFRDT